MKQQPIDVVYVLGKGSKWQDNELRYSLRSIEKHLQDFRNIFIVGECPAWVTGVTHVPMKDRHLGNQALNICEKVVRACEEPGVSAQFLFMNDDHFLLRAVSAPEFPYCFNRSLAQSIASIQVNSSYKVALKNTERALSERKWMLLNYDIHLPIVYDRNKLPEVVRQYDWKVSRGYVLKSLYCNTLAIFGDHVQDCKLAAMDSMDVMREAIADRIAFSISDSVSGAMMELLQELFPEKSKYEK